MSVPNFRPVGSMVKQVERKQTDRHTDRQTLPKILLKRELSSMCEEITITMQMGIPGKVPIHRS